MSRCGRMTGVTGAGGYHQEIFCENESTFTDGNGEGVCTACAVDDIGEGGMVTPHKAALWTDLIDELKRRHREHNKDLVEGLAKARADLKPLQDEVQQLRARLSVERDLSARLKTTTEDLVAARAEIDRLRVLRRVDGAPAPADAPRVPTTALLEIA